jgi:hypothetical protein
MYFAAKLQTIAAFLLCYVQRLVKTFVQNSGKDWGDRTIEHTLTSMSVPAEELVGLWRTQMMPLNFSWTSLMMPPLFTLRASSILGSSPVD